MNRDDKQRDEPPTTQPLPTFGDRDIEEALEKPPRTLEEALERIDVLATTARRAEQELATFVYKVSHDLKAPLRAIRTYAEFLVEDHGGCLAGEARAYLDRLQVNAEQVSQQLLGLLELSRIGRWRRPLEEIELDGVVQLVVTQFRERLEKSGVVCHVERGLPPVFGERQRLFQLLEILVENALIYRRGDGGHIWIEADHTSDAKDGEKTNDEPVPTFTVRDDGIGIDPRHHERIFQVFDRLHPKEFTGVGVGLTLAKRIVEYHRGRLWVSSAPDEGASFHVALDVVKATRDTDRGPRGPKDSAQEDDR